MTECNIYKYILYNLHLYKYIDECVCVYIYIYIYTMNRNMSFSFT